MEKLFTEWVTAVIHGFIALAKDPGETISDTFTWGSGKLLALALDLPSQLGDFGNGLYKLDHIIIILAISLILVKFVFKGFNTYVLWIDESADADPFNTLVNLTKAIAIVLCFGVLYKWIVQVITTLGDQLLRVVANVSHEQILLSGDGNIWEKILLLGETPFLMIMILIFFILYIILYFRVIVAGIELWILKMGVPLAAIGIIDSSQDLWKSFLQKFFQICLTILIQIVLINIGLVLVLKHHLIIGIAMAITAMSTPKMLREFMFNPGGANMNAILHNTSMIASAFRRVGKAR